VAGALLALRTMVYTRAGGDRAGVLNWAIIVVDGPSMDRSSTEREAARVRSAGIRLSAIGVGTRVNVAELTAIATTPSVDRYVFNYTQLADGFAQRFLCDNLALKGSSGFFFSGILRGVEQGNIELKTKNVSIKQYHLNCRP